MSRRSVIDHLRAAGRSLLAARDELGDPAPGSPEALVLRRIEDVLPRLDAAVETWHTEAARKGFRPRRVAAPLPPPGRPPLRCATCARRIRPGAKACSCGGEPEVWG